GVTGLAEDASIDSVDAACAAVTGLHFLNGEGSAVGDPREGSIMLPVASLADSYRRCRSVEGSPERMPRSPLARPCECGCGAPVRRRFLPGHVARLRSRLLREVRAGDAARRELDRLGWSR